MPGLLDFHDLYVVSTIEEEGFIVHTVRASLLSVRLPNQ